ncbi:MAG: hypothetical protein FWD57_10270 [Polyangiaceae bacterium]|nr:hypothetical protein [Polyangiaceae bacterium]
MSRVRTGTPFYGAHQLAEPAATGLRTDAESAAEASTRFGKQAVGLQHIGKTLSIAVRRDNQVTAAALSPWQATWFERRPTQPFESVGQPSQATTEHPSQPNPHRNQRTSNHREQAPRHAHTECTRDPRRPCANCRERGIDRSNGILAAGGRSNLAPLVCAAKTDAAVMPTNRSRMSMVSR